MAAFHRLCPGIKSHLQLRHFEFHLGWICLVQVFSAGGVLKGHPSKACTPAVKESNYFARLPHGLSLWISNMTSRGIWCALQALPAAIFSTVGMLQMAQWALQKHKRLRKVKRKGLIEWSELFNA